MKIAGRGADGTIRAPSGKALVELLDKFLLSVYLTEQKLKMKMVVTNIDEVGGSGAKTDLENRNSPAE